MAIDLKTLIKNQVHFGHQTSRWCPKMEPYIWGHKNNIHLIDVSKTAYLLDQAAKFLESVSAEGKSILWVGTKKAAQEIIERSAKELNAPYVVHRWVGGTFSNYRQVRKSIANLLHYEDILSKSEQFPYNKKELNLFQKRVDRLDKNVGGIRHLTWPVGAVVIVDVKKEHVCIKEALTMGIPVVALVDTNSDPSGIDYVIPANDDAPRSINVIIEYLAQAAKQGQERAASKPQEVSLDAFELDSNEPGLPEDEEEEAEKRRRSQGARSPKKGGATLKARVPRRPQAQQARHNESASARVERRAPVADATGSTIQTPAIESAHHHDVQATESTIQGYPIEKGHQKITATESTIQTPTIEKKKE